MLESFNAADLLERPPTKPDNHEVDVVDEVDEDEDESEEDERVADEVEREEVDESERFIYRREG